MHIRMVDLKKGLIGIHAEIEVSRDYLQHLFSQRTPVVYEVEEILGDEDDLIVITKHNINQSLKNILEQVYINDNKFINVYNLNDFLKKPKKVIKGTKMVFKGLKKQSDRDAVIAFLKENQTK